MRLRRTANIMELIAKKENIILQKPELNKGKWKQIFKNDHPLHLEIGTGKGEFISESALKYKEINYLGIEKVPEIIFKAAQRIAAEETDNVLLLLADAAELEYYFAAGEIERIYLNFSDPWPKAKHSKRRLTHPGYLEIYRKILKSGGTIQLKTDDRRFFDYSRQNLIENGYKVHQTTYDLYETSIADNIATEYEKKFTAAAKPICRLEAIIKDIRESELD